MPGPCQSIGVEYGDAVCRHRCARTGPWPFGSWRESLSGRASEIQNSVGTPHRSPTDHAAPQSATAGTCPLVPPLY